MIVLDIDTILVDRGEERERFNRGDDLATVSADQLDSMLRLRQAIEIDDIEADDSEHDDAKPAEEEDASDVIEADEDAEEGDWRDTPVGEVLEEQVASLLLAEGMTTVADVLAYGAEHKTLTSIDGIGAGREAAIQETIKKLAEVEDA